MSAARRLPWFIAAAATVVALGTSARWWMQATEVARLRAELAARSAPGAVAVPVPVPVVAPSVPVAAPAGAPSAVAPAPITDEVTVPRQVLEQLERLVDDTPSPEQQAAMVAELEPLKAEIEAATERVHAVVDAWREDGRLSPDEAEAVRTLLVERMQQTLELKRAVLLGDLADSEGREDFKVMMAETNDAMQEILSQDELTELYVSLADR